MGRLWWKCLGLIFLALGGIGAVLPFLPTTPFMLLAAFCFGKGSPGLRRWLEDHPRFGPPIRDWETSGAIAPRLKRLACTLMALTFAISAVAGLPPLVLVIQALCLTAAGAYVLTRPGGSPGR